MQKKLVSTWLLGGVLFCVLLVDLVLLNYNQQCSLYVQLDTAAEHSGGADGNGHQINGLGLVEAHSRTKTGTV